MKSTLRLPRLMRLRSPGNGWKPGLCRNRMTARDSYLHVLRSALWGEPLSESIPAGQLKEVLSIAKAQSTLPLVCQALLLSPGQELSDSQKVSMQNKLRSTVSLHLRSNHVIALLTAGLRARGIDPVLMKGQGVASYYKTPYLRECGDIDLYVGKARYTEACETVAAMAGIEDVSRTWNHISPLTFLRWWM